MDDKKILDMCKEQEAKLWFKHFSNDDAFELGTLMVHEARAKKLPIAIDISVACCEIFRHSLTGASPNNDKWLLRKKNMVYYAQKSTLRTGTELRLINKDMIHNWRLDPTEYSVAGGGFPINLIDTGFIGSICVSGLPDLDDHQFIIDCLEKYLKG